MKKTFLFLSIFTIAALACNFSVNMSPSTEIPITPTLHGDPLAPTLIPTEILDAATTTPEIFIALTQAIPPYVQLNGVILAWQEAHLSDCDLPNCPPAPSGTRYLRITLQALNLPADQSLDYKNLPQGITIHDNTGTSTPFNRLVAYAPATQQLTLYFTVPEAANVFGLQWPAAAEIPLTLASTPQQPIFEGTGVSVTPLSIVLSSQLASGARGSEFPRVDREDAAWFEKTPGHIQLKLEGYRLQGKFHQPQFYVYPALAYAELVPTAFESMHRLNNIRSKPGALISAEQLPAVPFFNAQQVFASNIQALSFQNGWGVRFLTEYSQYAAPVNNHELFYHFQGVTSDGAYYVVGIFPITAPELAETSDAGAPLPAGGVPYLFMADPNTNMQSYYASITDVLNATPSEAFTPTINQLDLLIQSMRITP